MTQNWWDAYPESNTQVAEPAVPASQVAPTAPTKDWWADYPISKSSVPPPAQQQPASAPVQQPVAQPLAPVVQEAMPQAEIPKEAQWAESVLRRYHSLYKDEIPAEKGLWFSRAKEIRDKSIPRSQKPDEFESWMDTVKEARSGQDYTGPKVGDIDEAMLARHGYERSGLATFVKKLPFGGSGFSAAELGDLALSVKAVKSKKATEGDYLRIAGSIQEAEQSEDKTVARRAVDLLSDIPGFAIEFGVTAGAYTFVRKGVEKGVKKLVGAAVEKGVKGVALRTVARGVGVVAQTAANPQLIAKETAAKFIPEYGLTKDDANVIALKISEEHDPSFVEALTKGAGSALIELGSERGGVALGWAGKALAKIPVASRIAATKAAIVSRWFQKWKTAQQLQDTLKRAGWHGVFGEIFFEERPAEVARGATGIERDYGTTGKILTNDPEGWKQLAVEAVAFAVPGTVGLIASLPNHPSRTQFEKAGGPTGTGIEERIAAVSAARRVQPPPLPKAQEQPNAQQFTQTGQVNADRSAQQWASVGEEEGRQAALADRGQGVRGGRPSEVVEQAPAEVQQGPVKEAAVQATVEAPVGVAKEIGPPIVKSSDQFGPIPEKTYRARVDFANNATPGATFTHVGYPSSHFKVMPDGGILEMNTSRAMGTVEKMANYLDPREVTFDKPDAEAKAPGEPTDLLGQSIKKPILKPTVEEAPAEVQQRPVEEAKVPPTVEAPPAPSPREVAARAMAKREGWATSEEIDAMSMEDLTALAKKRAKRLPEETPEPVPTTGNLPAITDMSNAQVRGELKQLREEGKKVGRVSDMRVSDARVRLAALRAGKEFPTERAMPLTVEKKIAKYAEEANLPIDQFKEEVQSAFEQDQAKFDSLDDIQKSVKGLGIDPTKGKLSEQDQAVVKGLDSAATEIVGAHPEMVAPGESALDAVWRALKEKRIKKPTQADKGILDRAATKIRDEQSIGETIIPPDAIEFEQQLAKVPIAERAKVARADFVADLMDTGRRMAGAKQAFSGPGAVLYVKDAVRLAYKGVRAGILTFAEFIDEAAKALGSHFDDMRPALAEAWNKEAERNPKLERATAEESMDFDWATGESKPFTLNREEAVRPAEAPAPEPPPAGKQEVMFHGLKDLPGQTDLFEVDKRPEDVLPPVELPKGGPPPLPAGALFDKGAARASTGEPGGERTYSLKHAATEADRAAMGMPERKPREGGGWQESLDRAAAASPAEIDALVDKMRNDTAYVPGTDEHAMLLRRRTELAQTNAGKIVNGKDTQADRDALVELFTLAERGGSEAGAALNIRKMEVEEDLSLPAVLAEAVRKNQGKQLEPKDVARIEQKTKRLAELQEQNAELEKKIAAAQSAPVIDKLIGEAPKGSQYHPKVLAFAERYVQWLEREAVAADKVWKDYLAGAIPGAGLPVKVIEVVAIKGAAKLARGALTIAEWTAAMIEDLGPRFGPHAGEVYQASLLQLDRGMDKGKVPKADRPSVKKAMVERVEKVKKEETVDSVAEKINKRFQKDGVITSEMAHKLAKMIVDSGITERDAVAAKLHEILQAVKPEITLRETHDLLSKYGKIRRPSQEENDIILRDIKRQLQLKSAIEDIKNKIAAKRSGFQPDKQSDTVRHMEAELNELKREGDYVVTDHETQLATALDAAKNTIRHRMADREEEIRSGKKIVEKREKLVPDAELETLREADKALSEEYDKAFPKPPITEARKLEIAGKALDRIADKMEADLNTGKIGRMKKAAGLSSPELDAKRARIDALRALRDELRANDPQYQADEQTRKDAAYNTHLQNRLAEGLERVANKDFAKRPIRKRVLTTRQLDTLYEIEKVQNKIRAGQEAIERRNRTPVMKVLGAVGTGAFVWRAALTCLDYSATLLQGSLTVAGHPVLAAKALPEMFRAGWSAKNEFVAQQDARKRENFHNYRRDKLALLDTNGSLSQQDEAFLGRMTKHIPGIAGSARAYTTLLNRFRMDLYDLQAGTYGPEGITPEQGAAIANFANVWTGRGSLGHFETSAVGMAALFFSPRNAISKFQVLLGQPFWRGDASTRKLILKEYGQSLAGYAVLYGLVNLYNAMLDDKDKYEIGTDWLDSKLGKIRIPGTNRWIDPLGGLIQASVFGNRMLASSYHATKSLLKIGVSKAGRKQMRDTPRTVGKFVQYKAAPWFGTAADFLTGEDFEGERVTPQSLILGAVVPMSLNDIREDMVAQGIPAGTAWSILEIFGLRIQTYTPKKK